MGHWQNSADPDQMPHNTASDQGLHCLLTTKLEEWKIQPCSLPKIGNRPVLLIRVVQSILLYGLNKLSFFSVFRATPEPGAGGLTSIDI